MKTEAETSLKTQTTEFPKLVKNENGFYTIQDSKFSPTTKFELPELEDPQVKAVSLLQSLKYFILFFIYSYRVKVPNKKATSFFADLLETR